MYADLGEQGDCEIIDICVVIEAEHKSWYKQGRRKAQNRIVVLAEN